MHIVKIIDGGGDGSLWFHPEKLDRPIRDTHGLNDANSLVETVPVYEEGGAYC
jgi:hypothetical protein